MGWPAIALAAVQIGVGIAQTIKANKEAKELGDRPDYQISDESERILRIAESNRNYEMPGYGEAMKHIRRGTSDAVRTASKYSTNPNAVTETAVRAQINENDAIGALDARDRAYRDQKEREHVDALRYMAGEKEKQFNINEITPWERNYAVINERRSAGNSNIFGGVMSAAEASTGDFDFQPRQRNVRRSRYNPFTDTKVQAVGGIDYDTSTYA